MPRAAEAASAAGGGGGEREVVGFPTTLLLLLLLLPLVPSSRYRQDRPRRRAGHGQLESVEDHSRGGCLSRAL